MAARELVRMESGRGGKGGRLRSALAPLLLGIALACVAASPAYALSPAVGSKNASNVDDTTVTMNGSVNPNGLATKTYFEYGPTVAYGSKTTEVSVGAGSTVLEQKQPVTGLTPNTTYHYRYVATNADGTSTGGDRTFTVGWSVLPAPSGTSMADVSCSAADACTSVKDGGIQRWNGSEWKAQTLAVPAGGSAVSAHSVSCPSSSACTAVGAYKNGSGEEKTLAEFWNGSEWKVQSSPTPASATGISMWDVSCPTSGECTAVGTYGGNTSFALRWNGSEWSLQTTVNPTGDTYLVSVSCVSSSFCMAAGWYREGASTYVPLAESWNGSAWSTKAPVKPGGVTKTWMTGVSCVSSSICYLVGNKEVSAETHERQTVGEVWNGTSWSLQTTPNPEATDRSVEEVSCVSQQACTAVGWGSNAGGYAPFRLRWNGSAWSTQNLPLPPGSSKAMPFAVSCPASRGCVLVGQYWNASSTVVPLAEANLRAAQPTVATAAATSVGETAATINGTVNPNGSETKLYFEYGTTISYGSKTAEYNAGSGSSTVERGEPITGLTPATTYHYRIVANNENPEASVSGDATFRTIGAPTVSTSVAEPDVETGEGATLKGQVNPNGLATTYQFEYGTSPGVYTVTVPVSAESAGSGTESKAVSYKTTGLVRGKTYYYRITATNSAGKSNGNQSSFTTPDAPGATTLAATGVTRKCAQLKGTVEPHGLTTEYWFEYGTTTSYGTKSSVGEASGQSATSVERQVCSLTPNTLYHFRLVAKNAFGTANGSDQSLTTIPAVTLSVGGTPLKAFATMKSFSSNLTFKGSGGSHGCAETEFTSLVFENPGATGGITGFKMQNSGGAACAYPGGATAKYSFPGEPALTEYTINKAEEGVVTLTQFRLLAKLTLSGFPVGECEYAVLLSGTYAFKSSLVLSLAGSMGLVAGGSPYCINTETLSGTFAVTSGGFPVVATH